MSEKELCEIIMENRFKKRINAWNTFKIKLENGIIELEVLIPSKGNVKIRKPVKHKYDSVYEYQTFRITKYNTFFDMGIYIDDRPENSIVYEIEARVEEIAL